MERQSSASEKTAALLAKLEQSQGDSRPGSKDDLAAIFSGRLTGSAVIEVDLRAFDRVNGVSGRTTEKTIMTWILGGKTRRFRFAGLPVTIKAGPEDQAELKAIHLAAILRLDLRLRNLPCVTAPPKTPKPIAVRLQLEVPEFRVGAGHYFGEIATCHVSYETEHENLAGLFR